MAGVLAAVAAHRDAVKLDNWLFYNYRKRVTNVHNNGVAVATQLAQAAADPDYYGRGFHLVPPTTPSNVFESIAVQKVRPTSAAAPPGVNLLYSVPSGTPNVRNQQMRIHRLTQYFDSRAPNWVPQKVLARGGQGMAVHYKYDNGNDDHDIVVKMGRDSNKLRDLLAEKRATYASLPRQIHVGSSTR